MLGVRRIIGAFLCFETHSASGVDRDSRLGVGASSCFSEEHAWKPIIASTSVRNMFVTGISKDFGRRHTCCAGAVFFGS